MKQFVYKLVVVIDLENQRGGNCGGCKPAGMHPMFPLGAISLASSDNISLEKSDYRMLIGQST